MAWKPEQLSLYGGTPPFEAQSGTSYEAALYIRPHINRLQQQVLSLIKLSGPEGLTDEEIVGLTNGNPNTLRPRRRELWQLGLIGTEEKRRNASGRLAHVWKLATFCADEDATTATKEIRVCPQCHHEF